MAKIDLTAERVRELFDYNPDSGVFTWKIQTTNRVQIGDIAGSRGSRYINMSIDGRRVTAHRIAWLHVTGKSPNGVIDHVDGDAFNNSFCNLRDVSSSENSQNRRRPSTRNTSGFLSVSASTNGKKWIAKICLHGKKIYLGTFQDKESAYSEYLKAKRIVHPGCTI